MNRCTSEVLESYLCDYGWTFRREGEGLFRTHFQGDEQSFPLNIIMTDNVISFVIQPFVDITVDWESWPEISKLLLELNARSALAKFSINLEGQIELSMEVLAGSFGYESFSLSMGLLGYYADAYLEEILHGLDLAGYRYSETLHLLT